MTQTAIQVLKTLAKTSDKRSKIAIVRELMPHIEATMKQGITLATIHAALTEQAGIEMKFNTFIGCYKRIKKEARHVQPAKLPSLTAVVVSQDNASTVTIQATDTQEVAGLSAKQRREQLGDRFIKQGLNPLLHHTKDTS